MPSSGRVWDRGVVGVGVIGAWRSVPKAARGACHLGVGGIPGAGAFGDGSTASLF